MVMRMMSRGGAIFDAGWRAQDIAKKSDRRYSPRRRKFEVRSSNEEVRKEVPFRHSSFELRTSNFSSSSRSRALLQQMRRIAQALWHRLQLRIFRVFLQPLIRPEQRAAIVA